MGPYAEGLRDVIKIRFQICDEPAGRVVSKGNICTLYYL